MQLSVQIVATTETGAVLSANRLLSTARNVDGARLEKEARAMLGELVDGNVVGDGAGEPGRWLEFPVFGLVLGSGVGEFVRVLDGCDVGELLGG